MSLAEPQPTDVDATSLGESINWTDAYTDDQFHRDKQLFLDVFSDAYGESDQITPQLDPELDPRFISVDPMRAVERTQEQVLRSADHTWTRSRASADTHTGNTEPQTLQQFLGRRDEIIADSNEKVAATTRGYARRVLTGLIDARSDEEALGSAIDAARAFEDHDDVQTVLRGTVRVEEVASALARIGRIGDDALRDRGAVREEDQGAASRYVAALLSEGMADRVGSTDLLRVFEVGQRNAAAVAGELEHKATQFNEAFPDTQIDLVDPVSSFDQFVEAETEDEAEFEEVHELRIRSFRVDRPLWYEQYHIARPDDERRSRAYDDIGGLGPETPEPIATTEDFEVRFGFTPTETEMRVAQNPLQLERVGESSEEAARTQNEKDALVHERAKELFRSFQQARIKIGILRDRFADQEGDSEDASQLLSSLENSTYDEMTEALTRETRQQAADELVARIKFIAASLTPYIQETRQRFNDHQGKPKNATRDKIYPAEGRIGAPTWARTIQEVTALEIPLDKRRTK